MTTKLNVSKLFNELVLDKVESKEFKSYAPFKRAIAEFASKLELTVAFSSKPTPIIQGGFPTSLLQVWFYGQGVEEAVAYGSMLISRSMPRKAYKLISEDFSKLNLWYHLGGLRS